MALSDTQKSAAQAIINIFETGQVLGDYAQVTLLPGDSGHLTYGRAQTTLASGNLFLLIRRYVTASGAMFARQLEAFLGRLEDMDLGLDLDEGFKELLALAGGDPVMHEVQDQFFDDAYWAPAVRSASEMNCDTALAHAVIYDGLVHGSWRFMRDRTNDRHGTVDMVGEKAWIRNYLTERRAWLASHANRLLQRTIYRMDVFLDLAEAENWGLDLPFFVRGVRIDAETLAASPPVRVSAEDVAQRNLRLTDPPMTGADVRALEEALVALGYAINVDGRFDESLDRIVKEQQTENGLAADGIVGPMTRAALGL